MGHLVRISTQTPSILTRAKAALQAARSVWSGPYSSKDPALSRLFGSGYEAYAGIPVTQENALTFSAVFSAVLQISSDVAKLPLNLHKRRKEGGSDHYIDSRLYYLLKHEPNPETSSMMFRQTLTAHALTCHGGYAEIERDMHGRPSALWILTPDRVEPFRREQFDRNTGRKMLGPLEYRIDGSDDQILPMRDVIHISGLGYDGITGYSVINKARQAIGLALAMEKFGSQYFGKGTVFGGWLETDVDLDEEQKKDIRENIEKFRAAQDSAWRVLVTGAGHKFHQFASKPNESQMDESRTAQVLEVARFFRMPPVKLGVNTPGAVSYASSEQADLDYYKGPLLDWVTREEQEFNRKLIPASERRQQFIKHNASGFLRADTTARTSYYEKMLTHGVFCADDVLELEDRNPQPDGQGKIYLVQGAMMPKDQLVEITDAKIEELKKKASEPTPAPIAGNDDQARAIAVLSEQLAAIGSAVATLGGEHQARLAQLRDDLEAVRLDKVSADAAVESATRTAETLTAERDAAIARAEQAIQAAAVAVTEREAMAAEASTARSEATAASLAAAGAEAVRQAAVADQTATGERLAELHARFETVTAELTAAGATLAARDQDLATLRTQLQAAERQLGETDEERTARIAGLSAEIERLQADVTARQAESETAQQQAAEERARIQEAADAAEQARTLLQAKITDMEAQMVLVEAQRQLAEQHLAGERAARIERMTATIAAHRGLIVDVFGRMARREAQQARAKQATPEKLRRWLEGFVSAEAPICVEAVLPAMRVRLAAQASTEDPLAVTVALVNEHMAAFEALIRDVLTVPAEDFHAELDRVLTRWETERANQVADRLLEQEVRHVRAI